MSWRQAFRLPNRIVPGEGARLMPQARIGGPMPWVIASMVALTVMGLAAALALANVANNARAEISGGMTVQIIEGAPSARQAQTRAALDFLQNHPDVVEVRQVPEDELAQLLEPWLGGAMGSEDAIASPSLIDLRIGGEVTAETLRTMRGQLEEVAPAAKLDAQANWLVPVFDALRSMQLLALGLVTLLMVTASAAVWLAARSALGSSRETINVIHHLGATDSQIASIFQRSIAIDAGIGGLAGLFLGLAAVMVLGQQFSALGSGLVAGGGLELIDWAMILAVPLIGILLAMATARATVLLALRGML